MREVKASFTRFFVCSGNTGLYRQSCANGGSSAPDIQTDRGPKIPGPYPRGNLKNLQSHGNGSIMHYVCVCIPVENVGKGTMSRRIVMRNI